MLFILRLPRLACLSVIIFTTKRDKHDRKNHVDSSATSATIALRLTGLELSESSTSSMYALRGWSVPEPFSFSFPLPFSDDFAFFPFFFFGKSHSYSGMNEST